MPDHVVVRGLQRAALAKRTGCNLETVRYYEKIALMPEPPRTESGYRVYNESHERRLRFILRSRELGFGIEEIRGLLRLVDGGTHTCAGVREMTLHHLADVRTKIADLQRLAQVLADTVGACSGDKVPDCPVIDALVATGPLRRIRLRKLIQSRLDG